MSEKRASAALKRWAKAHPEECKRRAAGNGGCKGVRNGHDLYHLAAKIASGPPLDCYDDIVRPCRGCRNIGRGDKCTIYHCPENQWWGTRGKCPRYEREEVAR